MMSLLKTFHKNVRIRLVMSTSHQCNVNESFPALLHKSPVTRSFVSMPFLLPKSVYIHRFSRDLGFFQHSISFMTVMTKLGHTDQLFTGLIFTNREVYVF